MSDKTTTDAFESELGRAQRERMEASGFYGAAWQTAASQPIMQAAEDGDAYALARLLHDDPSLAQAQERYVSNEAALHKAARGGHAACALILVAAGASPYALNRQGCDSLDVLLGSPAPEPSLRATARVLLDARERARVGAGASDSMTALSVIYQDGGSPEYAEEMRREAEEFERVRVLIAAQRLRASGQDCPRLCALLLRAEAPRPQAVSAALRLASGAGHLETARVLCDWLRLHADVGGMPDEPPPDPSPTRSTHHLCPACLAWWVVHSDAACPYCDATTEAGAAGPGQAAWWPWGKSDAPPPCLEAQERLIEEALWDLASRSARVSDSRARVGRESRSERGRALDRRLAQAAAEVRDLQAEYGHCQWAAEIASWWNSLELAVAEWDKLTFDECGRRIEWCVLLRGRWRSALAEWERRDAAERLALGAGGEPDVVIAARQALYGVGQIQQALLEARATLAVRADGRAGRGRRLPPCPTEPYRARVRVMTDLAHRTAALALRLDRLGEGDDPSWDGAQARRFRHNPQADR